MTLLRVLALPVLRACFAVGCFNVCAAFNGLSADPAQAQTRYAQSDFPESFESLPPLPADPLLEAPAVPGRSPEGATETLETIVVRGFEIVGSSIFSEEELAAATAAYLNRPLTQAELFEARSAITQLYTDSGYVNSGAYIPPQTLNDGTVVIQVLEGRLADINVSIDGPLAPDYVRRRLARASAVPLNAERLLDALRLLQLDPVIASVSAELATGAEPGTSILDVDVAVADTFSLELKTDNDRSPSVGSWRRGIALSEANLLGYGDRLGLEYLNTSGSDELSLDYRFPVNGRGGTIGAEASWSDSEIIEDPFSVLDIQSESKNYKLFARYPVVQTPTDELALGLALTHQRSQTDFLGSVIGESVGFPSPGADADGRTRLSALRFSQEWTQTGSREVLALFSEFSVGLDLLDASINAEGPDSRFFSWRGQTQWVRLLAPDTLLLLEGALQLSGDDLLPLEEFAVGGSQTVRGYRQNSLLTDSGFSVSSELRMPLYRADRIGGLLQIAPFFDIGSGWNTKNPDPDPDLLASVGLGLLWRQGEQLTARLDWGIPLVDVEQQTSTLQESGIHFSFNYRLF